MLGAGGEPIAVTIGNDVSSRDIEGANPLYIPQAKIFAGAARSGPRSPSPTTGTRRGRSGCGSRTPTARELFAGETSTDRMKRSPRELAEWAVRDNPIPPGSVLLTGTGLVPPDDYTLAAGPRRRDRDRGHRRPHEPGRRLIGTVPDDRDDRSAEPARRGRTTSAAAWVPAASGETYTKVNPMRPGRDGRRVLLVERGRRRRRSRRRRGCVRRLGGAADGAPRRVSHRRGGRARGARRAGRARHEHRDGQAAARGARRGRARRADPALRRERGVPLGRRALRAGGDRRAGLDAPPAGRRRRADHAVELPDRDSDLEARARAVYGNTVVLKLAYEAPRTGLHIAEAFAEAELPAGVLNVLTGRGSTVGAALVQRPARARDLVHRLRRDRPLRARRGDAARQARPARARRPQPADRARGRRPRPRGRGRLRRRVLVGGPEVHRDAAHLRPGRGLRRRSRPSCSRASSAARSATRSTPTSRSARS